MRLSDDVHKFTSACEHLLADMAILRPLTPDEVLLVKHYCNEVLAKIDSPPTNPRRTSEQRTEPFRARGPAALGPTPSPRTKLHNHSAFLEHARR